MKRYHGTKKDFAEEICDNNIDMTRGGGELGRGFYVGNLAHKAYSWAWHKHKDKFSVIEFDINRSEFQKLDTRYLSRESAQRKRMKIRKTHMTRTFLFGCDAVWSPVVGKETTNFHQTKFESDKAKTFLCNTNKKIISR